MIMFNDPDDIINFLEDAKLQRSRRGKLVLKGLNEIYSTPPNYMEIVSVLPEAKNKNTIYAYAPNVYIPSGKSLSVPLIAHESVHIRQQGDDPEAWWNKYLMYEEFRFEQELEAHIAEYKAFCRLHSDRNRQIAGLEQIARRLIGPLYGKKRRSLKEIKKILRTA